jgi:hypothetical protein
MDLKTFCQKIASFSKKSVYPKKVNLPRNISANPKFWDKIKSIYRYTKDDGKERAISLFWVEDEIVYSPIKIGTEKYVNTSTRVSVQYVPIQKKQGYFYYKKYTKVNNKIYSREKVSFREPIKKVTSPSFLFNIHTHPLNKKRDYNLWSRQDIKSFLKSRVIATGLITDELHFIVRTNNTPNTFYMKKGTLITRELLIQRMNCVLYKAQFNKKIMILDS